MTKLNIRIFLYCTLWFLAGICASWFVCTSCITQHEQQLLDTNPSHVEQGNSSVLTMISEARRVDKEQQVRLQHLLDWAIGLQSSDKKSLDDRKAVYNCIVLFGDTQFMPSAAFLADEVVFYRCEWDNPNDSLAGSEPRSLEKRRPDLAALRKLGPSTTSYLIDAYLAFRKWKRSISQDKDPRRNDLRLHNAFLESDITIVLSDDSFVTTAIRQISLRLLAASATTIDQATLDDLHELKKILVK